MKNLAKKSENCVTSKVVVGTVSDQSQGGGGPMNCL